MREGVSTSWCRIKSRAKKFFIDQFPRFYSGYQAITSVIEPWRDHTPPAGLVPKFFLNFNKDYYIVKMELRFADFPSYDEFNPLFTQFKIIITTPLDSI